MMAAVFCFYLTLSAENINLNLSNTTVKSAIETLKENYGYSFVFESGDLNTRKVISIQARNQTIEAVVEQILQGQEVSYEIREKNIIVRHREAAGRLPEEAARQQQDRRVTGTVTDTEGETIIGANVMEKGTGNGTVTDVDGKFSLNVTENAVLQISFIGYVAREIAVGRQANLTVALMEDTRSLDEVVIVAYGTQKKRDVTGSISTVKSDVFETATGTTNFASMLQGQAAGTSIQTSSGRLGANVGVLIRGVSSISAGTAPLWIIDGVPLVTGINIDNGMATAQSPMSLINPADIESIQVLKDAAATSIYGSRGSNGVIMITTKSGTPGRFNVDMDYSTGISQLPLFHSVKFVNSRQWFEMADEMKQAVGGGRYEMSDFYASKFYLTEQLTREQAERIDTDWWKETMRTGSYHSVNFSTTGGQQSFRYFVSGNYRNDRGVMNNDNLNRFGVRANVDVQPNTYFKVGTKVNLSMSGSSRGKNNAYDAGDGNKSGTSTGFAYVHSRTVPFEPVYSLVNPLEYYNPYSGNPVARSDPQYLTEDLDVYRVLANLYGEYTLPFLRDLSARAEVSADFVQANRNNWVSDVIRYDGSMANDGSSTSRTFNYNLFLTYNKTSGEHDVNATGGVEAQRTDGWSRSMSGEMLTGLFQELGTPGKLTAMSSRFGSESYLMAYFGRVNYKFRDRYLAGISLRRDGASVFTDQYRWGTFAALSA
ncbi:MAG: SusC/RagA family TonB-linked outer membrane protein, partial [Tannerella sp.]|nr:SusC/RagA family TonB-linked outer membrane protein [Tannerella sp.]